MLDAPLGSLDLESMTGPGAGPWPGSAAEPLRRREVPPPTSGLPVHQQFEALARAQPDAIAVCCRTFSITYGELEQHSNRLAHHLLRLGVLPGDRVAVCVQPSIDIVVALLAVWKVRAVYVPIDPTFPEALIRGILQETLPSVLLTQAVLADYAGLANLPRVCMDEPLPGAELLPHSAPSLTGSLQDVAYILYTSGTTGTPKGVVATHHNLNYHVVSARERYGFSRSDSFCSIARYTFSISMFELVSPLCCGASLRVLERDEIMDPARLLERLRAITVLHAGPSLLAGLFRHLRGQPDAALLDNLRHASSGGDVVPTKVLEEMKRVFSRAELFVIYGCTEISCMGCTYPVLPGRTETLHLVGRPFPDVDVCLLDERGQRVSEDDVAGEICFAGSGLALGYLDKPELTDEKFFQLDGQRFYRTGDLGKWRGEQGLEILGRRDYQVQIRGMRVELLGIEQKVMALGLADQCVVTLVREEDGDDRLVACLVRPHSEQLIELRKGLAPHLPDYMLPHRVLVLDALPVNRNGKLDRARVHELAESRLLSGVGTREAGGATDSARAADAGPSSEVLEQRIAQLFAVVIGTDRVGFDDDFFEAGGHSLLAVKLMQELAKGVGLFVSPAALFEHRTPRALAQHVQAAYPEEPRPIQLNTRSDGPTLFFVTGINLYRELARQLEDRYGVYGVYARRELTLLGDNEGALSIPELASDYVQIIRRQQAHGPYHVGGFSFGGILAYEVAQQLRVAGEQVEQLVLIDALIPDLSLRAKLRKLRQVLRAPAYSWARLQKLMRQRYPWLSPGKKVHKARHQFALELHDERLEALDDLRRGAYARAAAAYAPHAEPYQGAISLIVAQRRLELDPLCEPHCGFLRLAPQLELVRVESDHHGLLEAPMVQTVARAIGSSLARGTTAGLDAALARHEG
jgi:amino acid adenylation domain-containing protein